MMTVTKLKAGLMSLYGGAVLAASVLVGGTTGEMMAMATGAEVVQPAPAFTAVDTQADTDALAGPRGRPAVLE